MNDMGRQQMLDSLAANSDKDRELFITTILAFSALELIQYKRFLEALGKDTSHLDELITMTAVITEFNGKRLPGKQ